jgi:hypothetical protein
LFTDIQDKNLVRILDSSFGEIHKPFDLNSTSNVEMSETGFALFFLEIPAE